MISFICPFFILSILDFLADLLSTSICVDKILFISMVGICHTCAPWDVESQTHNALRYQKTLSYILS
jgi:hypothetical protein